MVNKNWGLPKESNQIYGVPNKVIILLFKDELIQVAKTDSFDS